MIRAVFRRHGDRLRGFALAGHAGTAERGRDVVCAAVSALAQGTVIGLTEVLGLPVAVEVRSGWLRCRLPEDGGGPAAQALARTLLRSLRSIQRGHPEAVRVHEIVRRKGGA